MVDLYGMFTFLVQAHMWYIHLHHIQIKNISNILMSDAKNKMMEDCHIDMLESYWVVFFYDI